jgi:hypothetical protein
MGLPNESNAVKTVFYIKFVAIDGHCYLFIC